MYETFYQLNAEPFRLSPDPGFCYQHRSYRKAMTYMLHALQRAEGFIMITGRPGTGKTTLISDLVQSLKNRQVQIARIVSTQLTANDLLDLVAYSFNLNPEGSSKAKILIDIERFLKRQHQNRRRLLLIVDEAQDMGADALEELRLLTNIQQDTHQLLQVFLVGQEQLRNTVNTPSLEQLHQRLIAATHLEPLDTDDTTAYIKYRLRHAGWRGDPLISTQAYDMIRQFSHGIPRQINQICNRLFLHGCIEEKHRLGIADLKVVIDELRQETLLPKNRDGDQTTPLWPPDPAEEDYEEEEFPPQEPDTEPAPALQTPAPEPRASPIHAFADSQPVPDRPSQPATEDPRLGPLPARTDHNYLQATKGNWKLLLVSGLLTGLLVIFLYNREPGFSSRSNQDLAADSGTGRTQSPDTPGPEAVPPARRSDRDALSGTVMRHSPPTTIAQQDATRPVPLQEQAQAQDRLAPAAAGLEDELRQQGLRVRRLDSNLIKVNLDSDGMFGNASTQIEDSALPALKRLATVLRSRDDLIIRVTGHTDSTGDEGYNLHLSRQRAEAVAGYLISQGISAAAITTEGRGDLDTRKEPADGSDPGLKRRVEIYISRAPVRTGSL